jgi:cytochrome c556
MCAINRGATMKRLVVMAILTACGVGAAWADSDAIAQRRALMKANGEATQPIVAILKGGPFDLAVVQNALKTYINAAEKMPALFPPDSKTGDTHALPAVWDNQADIDARFAKFKDDATAALASIKDVDSFKANMPGIFKNCGGCHELYRAKLN